MNEEHSQKTQESTEFFAKPEGQQALGHFGLTTTETQRAQRKAFGIGEIYLITKINIE